MAINIPENKTVGRITNKLPCVVLVDTSGSMSDYQPVLVESITRLKEIIADDEKASSCVDIGIITFDDRAQVVEPFGPIDEMNVPSISCKGMTAMHAAVSGGLDMIEKRRKEYKELCISSYRPKMFMLTDGGANDSDDGSFAKLLQRQNDKKITFFPIAIGEYVDKNLLASLRPDGNIFTISIFDALV